jgi:hypothetical protein
VVLYDQEEYEASLAALARAKAELEKAPAGRETVRRSGYVWNMQSLCEVEQGQFSAALASRQAELREVRGEWGEAHPDYATSLESLAEVYVTHQSWGKAAEIQRKVVAIRTATLGPHSATEMARDDLNETEEALMGGGREGGERICSGCEAIGEWERCRECCWYYCGTECEEKEGKHQDHCEAHKIWLQKELKRRKEAAEKEKRRQEEKKRNKPKPKGGKKPKQKPKPKK